MNKKQLLYEMINGNIKYLNCSFSQEGEDMILESLLNNVKGFYVDIGAYHPYRFSNTMKFYLKGWNGLNIDATPGSMRLFNKFRPRDINIEVGISSDNEELTYYMFEEGALNTFDANCLEILKEDGYLPSQCVSVKTCSIMSVLDQYVGEKQKIDFMDIDIEGFDERVLSCLDFSRYRPAFIMTESRFGTEIEHNFILEDNGYCLRAFTGRSAIYEWRG